MCSCSPFLQRLETCPLSQDSSKANVLCSNDRHRRLKLGLYGHSQLPNELHRRCLHGWTKKSLHLPGYQSILYRCCALGDNRSQEGIRERRAIYSTSRRLSTCICATLRGLLRPEEISQADMVTPSSHGGNPIRSYCLGAIQYQLPVAGCSNWLVQYGVHEEAASRVLVEGM